MLRALFRNPHRAMDDATMMVGARSERVYGSTVARRVHWEEETSVSAQAERAGVGEDDGVPGTKQKKQLVS